MSNSETKLKNRESKLKNRKRKLSQLKENFKSPNIDLKQLKTDITKLQSDVKKFYQHPGKDAQAFIDALNAFSIEVYAFKAPVKINSEALPANEDASVNPENQNEKQSTVDLLPRVELSEPERKAIATQNETQEASATFLEACYNALYKFYQSVLEWIDYLTPDYFKKTAQKSEETSELRNNSIFSSIFELESTQHEEDTPEYSV